MPAAVETFVRRESEIRSYCRGFPAVFDRAEGAELIAADGRRYLDFLAGCSTLNSGHTDPDMKQALGDHQYAARRVGDRGGSKGRLWCGLTTEKKNKSTK